ncbi:hypothetical protein [uncultured Maricaulis sp.]|uniref:hypothetical protein n=1 Tax=uncultured Maricaulis sp. TaxID=174710 RepID=UPI0030D96869
MIRVAAKPEYPDFDRNVRRPGAAFLAVCPAPTSAEFKSKNYWSKAAPSLHAAYSGICAYTAMYMPEQGTVDHFLPKVDYPSLAYEWANFRLANGRVNNAKGNSPNIIDPFEVEDTWFHMDVPDCLLRSNPSLERALRRRINMTINSLRLNQDDSYVQERCNILMEYARADISMDFLQRRYPFLAKELVRQDINQLQLRDIFRV